MQLIEVVYRCVLKQETHKLSRSSFCFLIQPTPKRILPKKTHPYKLKYLNNSIQPSTSKLAKASLICRKVAPYPRQNRKLTRLAKMIGQATWLLSRGGGGGANIQRCLSRTYDVEKPIS